MKIITFHKLGQICGVLGLDSHTHDRRHAELHDTHVVGVLEGGDGTGLDQELINANETANVAAGHIFDGLNITSHHEDGTLDGLFIQILLLSGSVVGAHDAGLLAGGDLAGEDTTEGVETTFVGGGHHLGDVHHQGTVGIAVLVETKHIALAFFSRDGGFIIRGLRFNQMAVLSFVKNIQNRSVKEQSSCQMITGASFSAN